MSGAHVVNCGEEVGEDELAGGEQKEPELLSPETD